MKIFHSFLATLLFVVLLLATYWIHVAFFRIDVIFYAAIADGVIAALVAGIAVLAVRYFRVLNGFEKFQLIVIWLLAGYAFAISVPTVIDRSLSFYILEKLQQRGGGIRLDRFSDVFTHEYLQEHHLVEVRLTEQSQSGTIRIENGCVKLTAKGEHIVQFSRWFRKNLLPKQRLLMGRYTDELTDPFRSSQDSPDYLCR
jgi:hypothetical protein